MKWGTKYGPEYVNRLHSMVQRHLTIPHRFVCLTDNREGLHPGIETFPIPSLKLPAGAPERGWTKLVSFSPDLTDKGGPELKGEVLFLDIDIVIVGNMNSFFEQPGEFLIIRDWQ
ncbi:MAG: glycosyltransferase, partial [Verrucomicrobia bacterium]|nr:glycosyltransferase [Verrucomicrobiota bacterium]